MGNCQAIDTATLVVQHPCGKVDKFYWPVSASEIMRMNPGHYVALLISTTLYHHSTTRTNGTNNKCPDNTNTNTNTANNNNTNANPVRLTRIKLLRPTDTLVLGQVYRLITTQEVMKGLNAKKHAKMKKSQQDSTEKPYEKAGLIRPEILARRSELDMENKVSKHERHRPRSTSSSNSAARSKTWQPSLQSISEAAS